MRSVRHLLASIIASGARVSSLATLAFAFVLALAAALPDAQARGGTVKVVMHSGLRNLDPVMVISHITRNHGYMIYDVLVAQDEHFQPKPQMADWQVSPDGKVYTFTLRDGLKFHDGAPVTAADAVASLDRWGKKDAGGQMVLAATARLEARDGRTIVWTLKEPFPALLNVVSKMSTIPAFIMPERIASTPIDKAITEHIGSGPFKFVAAAFQPGVKAVYERFADYVPRKEAPSWLAGGKVVKVDRVEWIAMPDQQTALNALAAGEIDYIEMPQADLLPILDGNPGVVVERRDAVGYELLLRMNFKHPPFDNLKMRQAVLKALNQQEILKIMFGDPNYYRVCGAIFGCDSPLASTAGAQTLTGSGDVAAARKLIAEAGYDGTPIVVVKATDLENVIYIPLGNWLNAQARSAKLTGMIPSPVTGFWNVEKVN